MSEHDPHRQLDLLGGVGAPSREGGPKGEKLAVRWAQVDGPGRLGCAAWPGSGVSAEADVAHLYEHHRASVLLAVAEDPSELVAVAGDLGLDVRHMPPSAARVAEQAEALAADVRAGRRTVSVGHDASATALPVCCALHLLGKGEAEAREAVGVSLAEPERAALRAFIEQRHATRPELPEATAREAAGEEPESDEVRAAPERAGALEDEARAAPERAAALEDEAPAAIAGRDEAARPVEPPVDVDALARSPRLSRVAGAVLGGAIGDAMGHPTELIRSFDAIRAQFGPRGVTGFELYWDREGARVAPYTDDTQMAECVLRALLWGREHEADLDATMRDMAARFVEWSKNPQGGHRAPGKACLAGCRNLERGVPWSEAGGATAGGCGSVMRAYPFGLLFAHDLGRAEAWAVAHSKLTHRDPIALAASAAMAIGVARVLRDDPLRVVLSEMVAAACRYSPKTAAMMARAIDDAQEGVAPETTLERLQGWAAHEAIAAAVYVFARHPDDPRAAILEGANTPGDSDSIATLAGALTGARAGVGAIPREWVAELERAAALADLALAI